MFLTRYPIIGYSEYHNYINNNYILEKNLTYDILFIFMRLFGFIGYFKSCKCRGEKK